MLGTFLPGTGILGWRAQCGAGTSCSLGGTSAAEISLSVLNHNAQVGNQLIQCLFHFYQSIFNTYFIDYAITVVPIFPLCAPPPGTPISSSHPLFSSYPWVIHFSSLATPFPTLFLTSPCLFCTYQFLLFNPYTFLPTLPLPPPN